jgi:hypothetical protein
MKALFYISLLLTFIFSCTNKKQNLFSGENLEGWTIFVEDSTVNPEDFFYINDGMIETVGVPMGYLRTINEYSNYHLHVEWRYPENPTNSGIFLHTTGPEMIWASHYQAQLKYENAGDFILNGVGLSATISDSTYNATEETKPLISRQNPTNEKPAGEWNSYDIICHGNTIEISVNGLLQNTATNCTVTKGGIGLQAEGSKIQFRNIWIAMND